MTLSYCRNIITLYIARLLGKKKLYQNYIIEPTLICIQEIFVRFAQPYHHEYFYTYVLTNQSLQYGFILKQHLSVDKAKMMAKISCHLPVYLSD